MLLRLLLLLLLLQLLLRSSNNLGTWRATPCVGQRHPLLRSLMLPITPYLAVRSHELRYVKRKRERVMFPFRQKGEKSKTEAHQDPESACEPVQRAPEFRAAC